MAGLTVVKRGLAEYSRGSVPLGWQPIYVPSVGSDQTSAVQSAINRAGSLVATSGMADVALAPGHAFNLGQLTPVAGVRVWAYGAQINPNLAGITNALFYYGAGASSLSRFELRGGTFNGTGSEGASGLNEQFIFYVEQNFGCNDILIQDTHTPNWGIGPFYIRNFLRARVINNTILQFGSGGGTFRNGINFVVDNTMNQGQYALARGNIIQGAVADALAYVNLNNAGPTDVQFTAIENVLQSSNVGATLGIEFNGTATTPFGGFIVKANQIRNTAPSGSSVGVAIPAGSNNAPIIDSIVEGNTIIVTSATGFGVEGQSNPGVLVAHNRISAATPVHSVATPGPTRVGNRYSTNGPMAGTATLVAGTVTVNTAEIQSQDRILIQVTGPSGTRGEVQLGTITPGTSFVINSIQPGTASTLQAADTSTVYWRIDH